MSHERTIDGPPTHRHTVWFLIAPGVQPLDLAGPHEVFAGANQVADHRGLGGRRYELRTVSLDGGPIGGESGLQFVTENAPSPGDISGTLLLPGGTGVRTLAVDDVDLVTWVAEASRHVDRLAMVCTGAFLAAAAGQLDGRRVTTHWAQARSLQRLHPAVHVDDDAIWVRDDRIWSSAGVTAGIDLALAMVEHDLGPSVTQTVAQHLVVFLRRPGGQSQFAAPVWSTRAESEPVRIAQELIHADPSADLSVERLAAEAGLSSRHLTRRFQSELGDTPSRYLETVRIEAARHHLESGVGSVEAIGRLCGFRSAETFRRAFHRQLGVSPAAYRQRFAHQPAPDAEPTNPIRHGPANAHTSHATHQLTETS